MVFGALSAGADPTASKSKFVRWFPVAFEAIRWVWSSFPWSYQRDPLSRGDLAIFLEDVDASKDNLEPTGLVQRG